MFVTVFDEKTGWRRFGGAESGLVWVRIWVYGQISVIYPGSMKLDSDIQFDLGWAKTKAGVRDGGREAGRSCCSAQNGGSCL
jgi:hypothetical protein